MERIIFSGMQMLIHQQLTSGQAVIVEDGLIRSIIAEDEIKHHLPAEQIKFPSDNYLMPGFIDLHVHGAKGCDVMDGSKESLQTISKALAMEGVTGFLATTMTADSETIEKAVTAVARYQHDVQGAAILGIHLEGPFLAPDKSGAQATKNLCLPDLALFKKWQKAAEDTIKLVTLAPELEGALPFIEHLHKEGVILSIGHTDATFEQTNAAIQAGCTQATHLFNAMSGMHQRQAGATGAILLSESIVAELIADGVHVSAPMMEIALRLKGKDHLILVSDAMRAKCMGDGVFELGGQSVTVQDGIARLANHKLAGSTLQLPKAIERMAGLKGSNLAQAIGMASFNPAHALKLAEQKGSIAVGKDADLVVINHNFEAMLTLRQGKIIFSR